MSPVAKAHKSKETSARKSLPTAKPKTKSPSKAQLEDRIEDVLDVGDVSSAESNWSTEKEQTPKKTPKVSPKPKLTVSRPPRPKRAAKSLSDDQLERLKRLQLLDEQLNVSPTTLAADATEAGGLPPRIGDPTDYSSSPTQFLTSPKYA
jgi:hypothetical protein